MAVFPQGRDSETKARASAPVLGILSARGGWSSPTPPRLPQPSRLRPKDPTAGQPRRTPSRRLLRHLEEQEEGEQEAVRKKGSFLLEGRPQSSLQRSAVHGGRTWVRDPGRGTSVSTGL